MKKKIYLYTDGACSGNPGPGGWGAILKYENLQKQLCGGHNNTTNNRMELTAVIEGLSAIKQQCDVVITSDSKYVCDGISKGWARSWKQRGWIKSDRKPALNSDLWDKLLTLCEVNDCTFVWVKGHSGHPENEMCDALATGEIEKLKQGFIK